MKRTPHEPSTPAAADRRALDPRRLADVRGGRDLGITAAVRRALEPGMQMQHNEQLVRR